MLTKKERKSIADQIREAQELVEKEIERAELSMKKRASCRSCVRSAHAAWSKNRILEKGIAAQKHFISTKSKRDIDMRSAQKETIAARKKADSMKPDWVLTLEKALASLDELGHCHKWRTRVLFLVTFAQKELAASERKPFYASLDKNTRRSRMSPSALRSQLESVSKSVIDLSENARLQMDRFMLDINVMDAEDARNGIRRFIALAIHIDQEYGARELWARACEEKLREDFEEQTITARRNARATIREQSHLLHEINIGEMIVHEVEESEVEKDSKPLEAICALVERLRKTTIAKDTENLVYAGYLKALSMCSKHGTWKPAFDIYGLW